MKDPSLFVIFESENPFKENMAYSIRNLTDYLELKVWQVGSDKENDCLDIGYESDSDFAWVYPMKKKEFSIEFLHKDKNIEIPAQIFGFEKMSQEWEIPIE